MTLFVIVAGLLLIAVLLAIVYPLIKNRGESANASAKARELNLAVLREQRAELERDRSEGIIEGAAYEKAREELERRTLEDVVEAGHPVVQKTFRRPLVVGVIGLVLPIMVIGLYMYLGEPAAMGDKPETASQSGSHAMTPQQIAGMVEKLAQRLQENPGDGQGWLMLARSYGALGRYPESVAAYGHAVSLLPPDAQILADFADTMAMVQGKNLQGEPEKLVRTALQIDPGNIKALALSGTIAFGRQDYAGAIAEWRKILAVVPGDSSVAVGIQGSIRDAENRMALVAKNGGKPAAADPVSQAGVKGTVNIDPSIASAAAPGDTLFVFARAVNGPKIPLAMMKKTVADLPIHFTLDDTMAMTPNFRLSQYGQVIVGARVSKSGDAMPRPGDLEGTSATVSPTAADVKVVINKRIN